MKYFYGSLLLIALIFAADLAHAHYTDWRKARRREREMRKYGMSPFKPVTKDWWLS